MKYASKKVLPISKSKKQMSNPMVQADNNPTTLYDNSERVNQINDAEKIHRMESTFQTKSGYVRKHITYGSHISFSNRSDIHYATAEPEIMDQLDNYYAHTITNIVDTGDVLQGAVEGHHAGELQETRLKTYEEVDAFQKRISKYKDKILLATGGTHDDPELAARYKDTYLSPIQPIYESLGIPYFANSAIVEFVAPVIKNNRIIDYASFWCVFLHCYGKPGSKKLGSVEKTFDQGMGVVKKFNAEHGTNITPDMICGGHFHANASCDYMVERNIYSQKGDATGTCMKTIMVRSNPTLQSSNSSSFNRSFPEVLIPNFIQYDVHFEVNQDYNPKGFNRQPKYIPVVTDFPILNKSGELTIKAKEYMDIRQDKDFHEELEKQFSKKPTIKLVEDLENK